MNLLLDLTYFYNQNAFWYEEQGDRSVFISFLELVRDQGKPFVLQWTDKKK